MSYRWIDNLSKENLFVLYPIVLYYSKGLSTSSREVKKCCEDLDFTKTDIVHWSEL